MHQFWQNKTFYFLATLLCCSVFFWITWQPLSSLALEWYFKNKLERQLGGALKIENVHWENGQLLLDGPSLFSKDTSQAQQPKFYAKQISIDYDFFFWQRRLLVKLLLKEPTFTMESTAEMLLKAALNTKSKKMNLFSLDWELSIPDGKIQENDHSTLPFLLEIANNQSSTGHFAIQFNQQFNQQSLRDQAEINAAVISSQSLKGRIFTETSGDSSVELTFDNTPLSNLTPLFNYFEGPFKNLAITSGLINGVATITLKKKQAPEFHGELTFNDVSLNHGPLSFKGKIPKATLKRSSTSSDTMKTAFNLPEASHFSLRNHQISSQRAGIDLNGEGTFTLLLDGEWSCDNEHCPLNMQGKGVSSHSKLSSNWRLAPQSIQMGLDTTFGELKSKAILNSDLGEGTTELHFEGSPKHIIKLLPSGISTALQAEFDLEHLVIDASANSQNGIYTVDALITTAEKDSIHAGFKLDSHFALQNGWFSANKLPLKKFVAPVIFPSGSFSLLGEASFKGTFNSDLLSVESQAADLTLENSHFLIETTPFKSDANSNTPIAVIGKHEVNLSTGDFTGEFLLKRGSFLDKSSQLRFSEVSGKITTENGDIKARHLLGYCCGLYLSGAIDLSFEQKLPKGLVDITINHLNGTVSNLKQFLAHFPALESLRFDAFPLQGNISLAKGPYHFHYDSKNSNGIQVQGQLSGSLSEGVFNFSAEDLALHELACDFTYDQHMKSLNFDNLQGTLFLGQAEDAEEYAIAGDLRFNDLFKQQAAFDFSLENNDQELLRLAGYTRLQPQSKSQELLHIYVDKERSHMMGTSPIDCKLTLAPSFHIDQFNMGFDLSFQQLGAQLRSLTKTKIWRDLGISEDKLSLVNDCKGTLHVDLSYDQNLGPFWFDFKGSDLMIGLHPIQKFLLRTKKQENVWSIEQLQLDRLSIAADIVKENRKWLFNFLGIRWGTSFLMGLKGQYLADKRAFTGNVNLLEIDSFKQLVHEQKPLWLSFQAENAEFTHGKMLLSDNEEGFTCTGQWQLNNSPFFSFNGGLTGHNIALFGYEFEFLQSDCAFSSGTMQLSHITLQDPAGFAQIRQVDIKRNEQGIWGLSVEGCEVTDWRPTLLRSREKGPILGSNSLIVNRLKIDQLQGQVGNPNSLTGQGEIYFNNHSQQRDSQNLLFAIPAEVINRIGLDRSILTPTSGTVYFTIGEGKFFPTKFKDVYSDGRLSQFNLASSSVPSYMDFDGNLNLNVRIKQYNLLLKLTELFTFNITGTIDKPNYSVDRKTKKSMSLFRKYR